MAEPLIEFKVDVTDLVRLAQACPGAIDALGEEMSRAMEESGMLLTTMVAARTPVNYGMLRDSITWPAGFEQEGSILDTLRGIIGASALVGVGTSTSEYVDYVEEGTEAHWAPIGPLKIWAMRALGDEKAAYGVRAKIAKSGTQGAHMFQRAWDEGGKSGVEQIWAAVPVKVMERFRGLAQ